MTQSRGKNDEDLPNASYSDADLTDDETQPVDSPFFTKGGNIQGEKDHKWLMNTMPVDDLLQCGNDFETQPVDLYGDTQLLDFSGNPHEVEIEGETQVVYDHDGVEHMHTQVLDEWNFEVTSDSDCEGSDRTEVICETQEISDNTAISMSQLDFQKTRPDEEADRCLEVQSDVLSNMKCHSGPVHCGFTSIRIASLRSSGLAAKGLAHSRSDGDSNKRNSSLELIRTMQDMPFVEENAKRKVNNTHGCEDNVELSKVLGTENRCKSGSSAARKLFTEDTVDDMEYAEHGNADANNVADLPQMFTSENLLAGLSYIDSQEPGDESQAKAFDVVDRFLKFNGVQDDEDIEMGKSSVEKTKSVPSAKRTKRLIVAATGSRHEVDSIFDWDDNCEDDGGGEFFQKNKELLFDNKISTSRRKPMRLNTDQKRVVGNCECTVEISESCKKKDTKVKSNSKKSNTMTEKPKSRGKFLKELNKNLIDMFDDEVEENKTGNDDVHTTDVGIDTQMAAEAMHSLCFGSSLIEEGSITANIKNSSFKSGVNHESQLRQSSQNNGSCSTRPATRQSLKAEQRVATTVKIAENPKKQCDGKLLETKSTRSNVRLHDAAKQIQAAERKEESAFGASKKFGINRGLDTPSNSSMSLKKRPFHELSNSPTPVAHRTRQHFVMNQQNCTRNIPNNMTKEINGEEGAFNSNKSLPDDGSCNTSTKKRFASKLGNMDLSVSKIGQMIHPKGIRTRRTRASMLQENNDQSNMRPSRSITDGGAPVYMSKRKKIRIAEESVLECSQSVHEEDASNNGAADAGGISVPGIILNGKAPKKCSKNRDVQCQKTKDVCKANEVDASPKYQPKTSTSPSTTPVNCMTPRIEASPICAGDEYHKRSCRSSALRSSLIRELNSLQSDGVPMNVKDSRRRRDMTNVRVLFSRHLDHDITKQQKKILTRLGASLASSMSDATHFVTDEFVRTRNILEAIAFGKPVVTHLWLESCAQASCLIDEKNHILRDVKKEKEFGFSMPISLARARQHPLLQEFRVFITPNTKPGTGILNGLVKAVHGLPIERCGRSARKDVTSADDILILSCEDDYDLCVPFLEKGIPVYSSELLLNGIVTQKLEYERYQLFTEHFKRTRSTVWMKKNNNQNSHVRKS
ncbi:unnamed protein product [Cuscuta campestris]|uniref:BRCT domain-containing protein n=1 Tax=Cuscuta campestris TaxID=132261 RepID=A0A484MC16_9ASTE|nr:unnamed protein product [Cuscuta campestris]